MRKNAAKRERKLYGKRVIFIDYFACKKTDDEPIQAVQDKNITIQSNSCIHVSLSLTWLFKCK